MNPDALQVALHLYDNLGSWPASVEVRCERGCTLAVAWLMPNDQVVVLVNVATARTSSRWREEGAGLADSPFIAMYAGEQLQRAHIWDDRPDTAIIASCRHAQKTPIVFPASLAWDAAVDNTTRVVNVDIPQVRKTDDSAEVRRARFLSMLRDTP